MSFTCVEDKPAPPSAQLSKVIYPPGYAPAPVKRRTKKPRPLAAACSGREKMKTAGIVADVRHDTCRCSLSIAKIPVPERDCIGGGFTRYTRHKGTRASRRVSAKGLSEINSVSRQQRHLRRRARAASRGTLTYPALCRQALCRQERELPPSCRCRSLRFPCSFAPWRRAYPFTSPECA